MCLALLCTSTQSSLLKWVSGGGINSPRHPKSRWLTASEKVRVGWTDAIFFKAPVHPMPLPCHLAVEILWHNCSDVMLRRCVGSSGAERLLQNLTVRIFKSVGWTTAPPSVHPVLELQSWRISVSIQMKRQIDRRCPHSDRQIIRCPVFASCSLQLVRRY
jgi:hypothetical protein